MSIKKKPSLLLCAALFGSVLSSQAAVLYSENFDNVVVRSISATDPIQDALDGIVSRQQAGLLRQVNKPYPKTGLWRTEDFALGAYGLDTSTALADAELIACQINGIYDAAIANDDFHWHAYLQERILFLYSSTSDFYPGRMSTAAENACLEMLWDWAAPSCDIGLASPDGIHFYWGSENHHLQAWVSFWGAAHLFKNHPDYQNRTYADGSTPAEMAGALDDYFKAYVRHRAAKGLFVEVASPTYAKYSLNTLFNLADFADDPELQQGASALLDIYWADWAIEQLDGIRGGSRHRSYPGNGSTLSGGGPGGMAWYLFGLGEALGNPHPGYMCAVTTLWRPSRATVGLALDPEGRGSYGYSSRRLGLLDLTPPEPPPDFSDYIYTPLNPDGGSLLRYTWCTPDFVMGMSQVESRSSGDWTAISSQNRWNGVIFGGHSTARIFTQRPDPETGSVYNAEWGVQHKGAMILQRLSTHQNATGQAVWFDASLTRSEISGWIFAASSDAYAAVRILDGGWSWDGNWAELIDQYSPVIIEVGRKSDYSSYTDFRSEILSNPLVWDGAQLDYTSTAYATTLTLFADESKPPQVDGVPLNFDPKKCYDAPYLQGDFAGGPVIINYGDDRTVHGVAPFADDAETLYHWDFETMVPTVHANSINQIYEIADGKFGAAYRCDSQADDQYMMTSSAWPVDQGSFRYQGWIRLNPGDTGGYLFHVYDQVYLSVNASTVTFVINRSGDGSDSSATNRIELSASISTANDWQYIEAVYDGERIKLVTEEETVSAPGIGVFVPNKRNVYIGSRKNKGNYVGDMDEVKISSAPAAVLFDDDMDGMDDAWEVESSGNLGASHQSSNADGDAWTDLEEFIAGTDPWDPASRFAISAMSAESVAWQAMQGKTYRVLSTVDPPESSFFFPTEPDQQFFKIEVE